ncbi:hypothetical protein AWU65_24110 [Paenibacillus glucanolyticus]|uniref:Uncharacterized protein n=2 Tax=Paenibacillus glucanolyticus TaxID=59843 RepID=A0A163M739_9BACL|nr:hypothetical protein AWU65_24110 [Paenibacillus glucanolyticus]
MGMLFIIFDFLNETNYQNYHLSKYAAVSVEWYDSKKLDTILLGAALSYFICFSASDRAKSVRGALLQPN